MSFLETLVRLDIVKQVFAREARFLYLVCVLWFTVCKSPEPPALERRCHPMSPLCVSTEITLAPHHWGKLRWVPVFGQYLEPTARGALQHPQMSIGDYTQRLWVGFSETAYSLCFEKAQHSLTEFNIMPDTSTAEAEDGEEPSISLLASCRSLGGLQWAGAVLWASPAPGQYQLLGRTLLPLLQPRAVCSSKWACTWTCVCA